MAWEDFVAGFRDRYGEGREDHRLAYYDGRDKEGKNQEGTRIGSTLGTNPTFTTTRDLLANANAPRWMQSKPEHRKSREDRGMGLRKEKTGYGAGQVAGTIAADMTQDYSRSLWWLLNAPQATGNVIAELAMAKANKDLYGYDQETFKEFGAVNDEGTFVKRGIPRVQFEDGDGSKLRTTGLSQNQRQLNERAYQMARERGYINEFGAMQKGISLDKSGRYHKRTYNPGDVAALGIPTGIAINAGMGLLNPFGGAGGYEAALPSADDPSKTSNVIGEVAAKYILGRTGNLLPYDEFVQHRPDVDIGEYNRYKAFKYDKELDYDISDGDANLLPFGVLKATADGIHGPEVQFLGRSLPVTTTMIPYLGALAGGVAGVRTKRPIARGLQGGLAGLAAGGVTGMIAEEARRRASSNNVQYEGGNAEGYLS